MNKYDAFPINIEGKLNASILNDISLSNTEYIMTIEDYINEVEEIIKDRSQSVFVVDSL